MTWFIVIAALISINGLTFVSPALVQTVQDERLVYISKKELSYQQIGLIQMTITVSFNLIIMGTSLGVKDDPLYLLDISSNAVIFVAFICYISLIVAVLVNLYTKRVEVTKVKGMYYYAGFVAFLLLVSIVYIVYSFVAFKSNHNTLYSLVIIVGRSLILWGINKLLLNRTAPPFPYKIKTPVINKINQ